MGRVSRNTKQKEIITRELKKFSSFFTAEEVYQSVKKSDKKIGLATIYRFLKEYAKKEELHSYKCGKKTVYSTDKNNHSHFICKNCGTNEHIQVKNIDFIKKKIKGSVCHFQIDIYGICKNCVENFESKRKNNK